MASPWIFICPSSRGIGHALTRRLLLTTTLPILATTRRDPSSTKASLLSGLSQAEELAPRLSLVKCDVTDESTMSAAAEHASTLFPSKTHHLRLACAIPGVLYPEKSPKQVDYQKSLESFQINAMGPLMLMKYFGEFLPKKTTKMEAVKKPQGEEATTEAEAQINERQDEDKHQIATRGVTLPDHAVWLSMSARVGSVSDNKAGGWYSYRASKTAVNSLSKSFDNFLKARSGDVATAVSYHPGTVKTELSKEFWDSVGEDQLFSPEYAAERMVDVISGLKVAQRGKCWDWKNEEILP